MDTLIKTLKYTEEDEKIYQIASKVIKSGGLVAFPTETVYGLGADGLNEMAARKIYAAKGRPSDNPLILHISNREQLKELVFDIPSNAEKLLDHFWPGPLTGIFAKKKSVPYSTTGGLESVAVRMPNHPAALKLIQTAERPIAAPSANLSGHPSPTLAQHVIDDFFGRIDMILDGGAVGIGLESTIIDFTSEIPTILRPGYITQNMIQEIIGIVDLDPALNEIHTENLRPKAPGMKYRHYAPKAELIIVEGSLDRVVEQINYLAAERMQKGERVGVIATEETKNLYDADRVEVLGRRDDEASVARNLYRVLRRFDTTDINIIYSEAFSYEKLGQAIMNRLLKAAGHHKIIV